MVLDESIQEKVLDLWLFELKAPRDIEAMIGVRKSTASDHILRFRKENPHIDELRKLWKQCKEKVASDISIADLLRTILLVQHFNEEEKSVGTLDGALKLVSKYGSKAEVAIDSGLELLDRSEKSGKSFDVIVEEDRERRAEVESLRSETSKLNGEKESLLKELPEILKLRTLKGKLDQQKQTIDKLDGFIDDHEELSKNGFSMQAAKTFARELAKLGMDPILGAQKIAELIEESGDLQESITKLRKTKGMEEEGIRRNNSRIGELRDEIAKYERISKDLVAESHSQYESLRAADEAKYLKSKSDHDEKISELEKEENSLNSKVNGLRDEEQKLEKKTDAMKEKIAFVDTFYTFLINPQITPRENIGLARKYLETAEHEWGAGGGVSGTMNLKMSRDTILSALLQITEGGLVRKSDYEAVTTKHDADSKELEKFRNGVRGWANETEESKKQIKIRDSVVNDISRFTLKSGYREVLPVGMMHDPIKCKKCKEQVWLNSGGTLRVDVAYFCQHCKKWIEGVLPQVYESEVKAREKKGL